MIDVFNGNVDKALRDLNRQLQLNGVVSEVKSRIHYVKPCEKRAERKRKAIENRLKNSARVEKRPRNTLSIFNSSF